MLAKAQTHDHAIQVTSSSAQEEADQACTAADEQARHIQRLLADQHFTLVECLNKDETHELVKRRDWGLATSSPGLTWCDLNKVLPEEVLAGRETFNNQHHMKIVQDQLRSLTEQRAMAILCGFSRISVLVETHLQDFFFSCTNLQIIRTTLLLRKDKKSEPDEIVTLSFLTADELRQSESDLGSCLRRMPKFIFVLNPPDAQNRTSRWAKLAPDCWRTLLPKLCLPKDLHIAEIEVGGGEMLSEIVRAKLDGAADSWASWVWLGNVPSKVAARARHMKEAIGEFARTLAKQNATESEIA